MDGSEYLVHHGCACHLGRFRAQDIGPIERGSFVVVRTRRGLELGEVLRGSPTAGVTLPDPFVGELVRRASALDFESAARHRETGRGIFEDGVRSSEELSLPLTLLDVEILLDGKQALLHAVRHAPGDEGPWLAGLGEKYGVIARLYDLAAETERSLDEDHGCGSCGEGGCGENGCGSCESSGCNSCSAGAGQALVEYFAELREQMFAKSRVALL